MIPGRVIVPPCSNDHAINTPQFKVKPVVTERVGRLVTPGKYMGPCNDKEIMAQGITFEKARQVTNRSLKMTIWSLGSYLCYEENYLPGGAIITLSAMARHFTNICQEGAILTQPRDRSECL